MTTIERFFERVGLFIWKARNFDPVVQGLEADLEKAETKLYQIAQICENEIKYCDNEQKLHDLKQILRK